MTRTARHALPAFAIVVALAVTGCATTPATSLVPGGQGTIEGSIASIDTQPWTYDGNAVIRIDTDAHGTVPVQLPARWNLCKAGAVDVEALAVGMRVRAVGTVDEEGGLVVCQETTHRLVPVD